MKRKLIDEKGRLFGVISVIDILVVLVVIVLGAAVYSRFFTKEQTAVAVTNDKFSYELRINGVRSLTLDALRVGDVIYDNENNTRLGVITDIEYTDAVQEMITEDGTYVIAPVENRYDVILSVDSEGLISSGRYYASRTYEINVNTTVSFYTKYCDTSGCVWSIG